MTVEKVVVAGQLATRRALLTENLRIVPACARKCGLSVLSRDWDDALQEGALALWKACVRFDPTRGTPFRPYARMFVLGGLKDYLCRRPVVADPIHKAKRKRTAESEPRPIVEALPPEGLSACADSDAEAELADAIDRKRASERLRAAVPELPRHQRRAVESALRDVSVTAYARKAGLPRQTASDHKNQAVKALVESCKP